MSKAFRVLVSEIQKGFFYILYVKERFFIIKNIYICIEKQT